MYVYVHQCVYCRGKGILRLASQAFLRPFRLSTKWFMELRLVNPRSQAILATVAGKTASWFPMLKSHIPYLIFRPDLYHSLDYCLFSRRRYDFQNPSRMDRNVEMFMTIEKSLVQVIVKNLCGPSPFPQWKSKICFPHDPIPSISSPHRITACLDLTFFSARKLNPNC